MSINDFSLFFVSPHNWYDHVRKNQINRPLKLAEQFSIDSEFENIIIVSRVHPKKIAQNNDLDIRKKLIVRRAYRLLKCNKYDRTYYLEHSVPFGWSETFLLPLIIKKVMKALLVKNSALLVADPKSTGIFNFKNFSIKMFDAYDDWSQIPMLNERHKKAIRSGYKRAKKMTDIILVNTTSVKSLFNESNGRVEILPNTSSLSIHNIKKRKENKNKKVVGYIGNIYERIDYKLVKDLVIAFPNIEFQFVGKYIGSDGEERQKFEKLLKINNVTYIDAVPYSKVPEMISSFDVCIIPHHVTTYTLTQDSMKMYDFLALGKPVVTTPLPPSDLLGELVYVADTTTFIERLSSALQEEENSEKKAERINFIRNNGWDKKTEYIYKLMGEIINEKTAKTKGDFSTSSLSTKF